MLWELCIIIWRDLGFFVVAHRLLQREMLFNFDEVEHWIPIVSRHWWQFRQWLGTLVAGRSKVLLLRTTFKEWIFRVASCCFYMILTDSHLLYLDNLFLFWWKLQRFPYIGVFSFFRGLVEVSTLLFFSQSFRVISPDNLSPYQGTLFLLSDFLRHAVCDVNPVNIVVRQSVTLKGELVPVELFSQTSASVVTASF